MPFSASDHAFLQTHDFYKYYDAYRDRLLVIAKQNFNQLKILSQLAPSSVICELALEVALTGSTVFADIVIDHCQAISYPAPQDPYWCQYFAGPIARYVTSLEWTDITS